MPNPKPHDGLFKRVFSRRENAVGELRSVLPAALLECMDLDRLEIDDRSFVDPELTDRHADQLYSVPVAGEPGFVYVLFEHQSSANRWTALRLLAYMVRIWEAFLCQHPGTRRLPPIVPLVLHHDDSEWRLAERMHDLLQPELMALPALAELTPDFRFLLDDISRIPDQELMERRLSDFGRLALWALRDGRTDRLLRALPAFAGLLEQLLASEAGRLDVGTILRYIYVVQGRVGYRALARAIPSPRMREAAMTIAEELRLEGLKKGVKQGLREGRKQQGRDLLRRQIEIKFGAEGLSASERLDSADLDTLSRIAERILTAKSPEELFEG